MRRRAALGRVSTISSLLLALTVAPAPAMELSGILLYGADAQGNRIGPAWHTSGGPGAMPLGFNAFNSPSQRTWPFGNDSRGEIAVELLPATHVITLDFQPDPDAFPNYLVVNLFFNGDKREPKISFLVPYQRGFTHGMLNPAYSTYSLYLEEVDNSADVVFEDGTLQARIGAAFYGPSSGDNRAWFSSDFFLIDRVGPRDYEPDGEWDGLFVFELQVGLAPPKVTPASKRVGPAAAPPVFVPPRLVEHPLTSPPSTPTFAVDFPTARTTSTSARSETPVQGTPTSATTPTTSALATPAASPSELTQATEPSAAATPTEPVAVDTPTPEATAKAASSRRRRSDIISSRNRLAASRGKAFRRATNAPDGLL